MKNQDIILSINQCIGETVTNFENILNQYIYGWRVILFKRIEKDQINRDPMDACLAQLEKTEQELNHLKYIHESNLGKLKK